MALSRTSSALNSALASGLWLAGRAVAGAAPPLALVDKHSLETVAEVPTASADQIASAVTAGVTEGKPAMASLPLAARRDVLNAASGALAAARDDFASALMIEAGKTADAARGEIDRAVATFRLCADAVGSSRSLEEAGRLGAHPSGAGYEYVRRPFPIGLISAIAPFNFPVNLAVHKIGPAIAAGCPVILKPSPATPATALMLGKILADAGLADVPGSFSILPAHDDDAPLFTSSPGIDCISFTGSPKVGWGIKASAPGAGRTKVVLELGGNAAAIVDAGADVAAATSAIARAGFGQAGQSCISVQNVFLHSSIAPAATDALTTAVAALPRGDPAEPGVVCAPMISPAAAAALADKISDALARPGFSALVGGDRPQQGSNVVSPTLIAAPPSTTDAFDAPLCAEEAFGPVVILHTFDDLDAVFDTINAGPFGLQTGIFTPSLAAAHRAFNKLDMGGVVINDVPTTRMDAMPYGGVKDSGEGFEGPTYAIDEFSVPRLMLINTGSLL
ncbi:aldehyde Dehydrogenase [Thecamonas trahens ATCC 50062]|uniref:NADP-dependent glyceraldehyde-3-phosphate dehydrogenase n=1 Tax=Thecamonas trahens ATCC 50062 TaxID=461836 RepID=A0A0L0D9H9_THETB|nr:aldehyde Dehydrogenase [Thecamonas trahens ATCC 50062]KNC47958.1 aldehyde Dehydrogenase [Thecamonas trahens ATCC 50062]|eukprot:XP_013758975.1 aldehyde Dehydrogenase [Thecamonas trahens ATCC 50062]